MLRPNDTQLTAGVYSYLPMALRSLRKIEDIKRDEMNRQADRNMYARFCNPSSYVKIRQRRQLRQKPVQAFRPQGNANWRLDLP
jgi:prolyl-tRNA synthetase